jgi:hypothetical protein
MYVCTWLCVCTCDMQICHLQSDLLVCSHICTYIHTSTRTIYISPTQTVPITSPSACLHSQKHKNVHSPKGFLLCCHRMHISWFRHFSLSSTGSSQCHCMYVCVCVCMYTYMLNKTKMNKRACMNVYVYVYMCVILPCLPFTYVNQHDSILYMYSCMFMRL